MPSKKSAPRAAPKVSSSAAFSNSAATSKQLTRSAVLKHAFAPPSMQLNLFASVVQGLNAQVLRIYDTLTGQLRGEYSLDKGRISCLDWGHYSGIAANDDRPTKKRKTTGGSTEADYSKGDAVVAVGTFNSPNIELHCPAKAKVVSTLKGGHIQGVKDFRFVNHSSIRNAWSLGDDGKLIQWNTIDGTIIQSITLSSQVSSSNILFPIQSHIFCAFSSIYGIDPELPAEFLTFSGFSGNVHSIFVQMSRTIPSRPESIIGAAESERNIMVFDFDRRQIKGQMVASNAVERVVLPPISKFQFDVLAAITDHGEIELFEKPFDFRDINAELAGSSKAARKGMTRRPKVNIKIARPGKAADRVAITNVEFEGDALVLGWIEGGAHPCFERILWRDSNGAISLSGDVTIEKARNQNVITNAKMNGLEVGKTSVDDAQTVISKGGNIIGSDGMELDAPDTADSSSAEASSSDDEDEQDTVLPSNRAHLANGEKMVNGDGYGDDTDDVVNDQTGKETDAESNDRQTERQDQAEQDGEDEADEAADGLSFGELLRAKAPEPVDVSAAFPAKAQMALVPRGEKSMDLPSGMSLATVLAQSLRTNDRDLLETCFHAQDLQVVRRTIERLDSVLAGALLERLAERFHNRPGRAGSLMVWIQWTLVAHGGYLAGQTRVLRQLRQLHSVVRERAQALQPLLQLKGKLDLWEAQKQLQRAVERSQTLRSVQEEDDEEEEEDAIYVEGQNEIDSEDDPETTTRQQGEATNTDREDIEFDSEDEEIDPSATAMDLYQDGDDSEASEDDLIDDEAEEGSEESGMDDDDDDDDDAIDYDDVDSLDDESEPDNHPVGTTKPKAKVNGIVKKIR